MSLGAVALDLAAGFLQVERRGYYICDRPSLRPADPIRLIYVPDGKSMMGVAGNSMLMSAVYLGALTQGKSQAEAFGITWALGGLLVTKFAFTEAEGLGAPKTGPLVWAVISAGIAYACLK